MARLSKVGMSALLGLGVKYGPAAYRLAREGQGPAQHLAQRRLAGRRARRLAFEHAAHLIDGSVLPVFDGDLRVWVVFSGDEIVGSHPVVRTPTEKLLVHYDLSKRQRPRDAAQVRPRPDTPHVRDTERD